MPVQAAHKLEPPLAYAASKARQPPKLPRHKPYASCGTYPPNTMPPSVQDEVRARSARKSQKDIHSTTCTLQPHRQRSPACAATFTLSCPPALPPAGIAAGTEPAAACALARVPRMECKNAPAVSVACSRDSTAEDSDPAARTVVTARCVAQSHAGIPACSAVEDLPRTMEAAQCSDPLVGALDVSDGKFLGACWLSSCHTSCRILAQAFFKGSSPRCSGTDGRVVR